MSTEVRSLARLPPPLATSLLLSALLLFQRLLSHLAEYQSNKVEGLPLSITSCGRRTSHL